MKPLFYIMIKSIKNGIKELKKKPGKIIMYLIFIGLLSLALFANGKSKSSGAVLSGEVFGCIVTGVMLLFTVPDILTALDNGATFFRAADVNLVFTAPTKPQNVLIYGFIKQMYTVLISTAFVLFQIPNLYRFANVKPYAIAVLIIGMFIMLLINSLIKLIVYSVASKNEKNKRIISYVFKGLGIILVAIYVISLYMLKSPVKAIVYILNNKFIAYIPVYGWIRNIEMASINGISASTIMSIAAALIFAAVCFIGLYLMEMDYYEDVLSFTERREEILKSVRTGQRNYNLNNRKRKVRKVKYTNKGSGASAIFFRQLMEYRKTGFGFINTLSIIYFIASVTIGIFVPHFDLRIVFGFSVYFLMIFSFAGKWQQELTKPYVYLIPDSSFKKVFFSTAVDNVKNLVDGCIIFLPIGILFKSDPVIIILSILGYMSVGSLFVYGGVLTQRIVGNTQSMVIVSLIRMFLLLLIVVPSIVVFIAIGAIFDNTLGHYLSYIALMGYTLLFSCIIILLSKGIFENIELNN